MRKILCSIVLLSGIFVSAQTTVVEEKFEKKNNPSSFQFLQKSNKIVIFKGKKLGGLMSGSETNNICSYDAKGVKEVIVENEKLYQCVFSSSEKVLQTVDLAPGKFSAKLKYLIDNKFTSLFDVDQSNANLRPKYFKFGNDFTDKYELKLKNQKDSPDIDFEKDDIYLKTVDIITRKKKSYKLEKPSITRLKGTNFIAPEKKIGLTCSINSDETIDFVTKSISNDYKKTILYKTTYNTEGKIVSDIPFELNLVNKVFLYSNTGGGFTDSYANASTKSNPQGTLPFFADDSSINNYYVDTANKDVYIYGLYGDEMSKLNKNANAKGYYIFKFDKEGKKIWESINKIDDKDFNDEHYLYFTDVGLSVINDKLCFYAFVNEHKEYLNYGLIEKISGKQIKSNKIVFHEFESRVDFGNNFFKLNYEYKDIKELKEKKFNIKSIIAYDVNPKFSEYIKNVKSKNELHFLSIFSDQGIWLVETDNKDYYKVTTFND